MWIKQHRSVRQRCQPALQPSLTPAHRLGQVHADPGAARIKGQQRLQALAVVGQMDGPGLRGCGSQQGVQGGQGEVWHVYRAEQQALIGVLLHQAVQGQQGAFPGGRLGLGGDGEGEAGVQGLSQLQVLWVAAQQGDRRFQLAQQQHRALQPAASFRVGQQRLVTAHAPALAAAEQAGAQGEGLGRRLLL